MHDKAALPCADEEMKRRMDHNKNGLAVGAAVAIVEMNDGL